MDPVFETAGTPAFRSRFSFSRRPPSWAGTNPRKGLSLGDYSTTAPGRGQQTIAGPAVALAITPAYAGSVFALGVGVDVADAQSVRRDFGTRGSLMFAASAVAMLTPERPGVDASLAFGLAMADLSGFIARDGSELDSESMFGPRVEGRLGYRFSSGLGLATTASYAHLTDDLSAYEPLVLAVRLTYAGRWSGE